MENKVDHCNFLVSSVSNDSSSVPPSLSAFSAPYGSSDVESYVKEDTVQKDMKGECAIQPKPRKKPQKKSRSLLGLENLSFLLKSPMSPSRCRRVQSMGYFGDLQKTKYTQVQAIAPQKQMCILRRPILSCDEGSSEEMSTLVKVVIFGGNREVGRLARAYCNLQKKENKCPQLIQTCKLQFYFIPTKKSIGSRTEGHTLNVGQTGSSAKPVPCRVSTSEDVTSQLILLLEIVIYEQLHNIL